MTQAAEAHSNSNNGSSTDSHNNGSRSCNGNRTHSYKYTFTKKGNDEEKYITNTSYFLFYLIASNCAQEHITQSANGTEKDKWMPNKREDTWT